MPDTGVTREYWLNVEEVACAPDGYNTTCLTYNGTVPGPTLFVSGDAFISKWEMITIPRMPRAHILTDNAYPNRPIGVTP